MNAKIIENHGFEILDLVAESSRTVVCKANQKNLDRTVTLRILTQTAATKPVEVEHFLSIARKVAKIKSDSLAAIFDIVSEKDIHYVAMEYVEGPTLEDLVSQHGPLPAEQILRIAASLSTSLKQLWEKFHIVHRNLKSAIVRLDPRGVAKITDFSLAIVAGPGVDATAMDDEHIVGTPCFLSPEQAQGAHTLTTQSDMYALGAVLYQLATGVVPFEGEDVVSILSSHVKKQIPPPHQLNKTLPVSFSWFIHRLMMKNPANRYANWQEVQDDIRLQLTGEVPSCVRPGEEYLSTIEASFDTEQPLKEDVDAAAPHIRLNRKERDRRIAAYQAKALEDEHANEIRRETLMKEMLCWGTLAVWLLALFWFRAVFQEETPRESEDDSAVTAVSETGPESNAGPADTQPPTPAETGTTARPPTPAPPPAPLPAPVTAAAGPALPSDTSQHPAASPKPVNTPQPKPKPAPKQPAPVQEKLPEAPPPSLVSGLAQALADSDLDGARKLAKTDPARFQGKARLIALLDQIPEPDALVANFLQTQIGKPLLFEHNGKQRTIIVRGVENGVIQIEANGRGAEFPISKLSADEKLQWMASPQTPPQTAAYCLALLHSERNAEVPARAAVCPPALASVLTEAAALARKTAATTSPQ